MTETKTPQAAPPKTRKVRGYVVIREDRCKGCGFCIAFCPPRVLGFHRSYNAHGYHHPYLTNPDGCTGCDLCGLYCPDFAIYGVMVRNGTPPPEGNP